MQIAPKNTLSYQTHSLSPFPTRQAQLLLRQCTQMAADLQGSVEAQAAVLRALLFVPPASVSTSTAGASVDGVAAADASESTSAAGAVTASNVAVPSEKQLEDGSCTGADPPKESATAVGPDSTARALLTELQIAAQSGTDFLQEGLRGLLYSVLVRHLVLRVANMEDDEPGASGSA